MRMKYLTTRAVTSTRLFLLRTQPLEVALRPENASVTPYAHKLCTAVWPLPPLRVDVIPAGSTNLPSTQPLPGRVSAQRQRSGSSAEAYGNNLPKSPCLLIPLPMYQRGPGKSIFPSQNLPGFLPC